MRKSYMVRLEEDIKKALESEAKKRKIKMPDLLEKILINGLKISVKEIIEVVNSEEKRKKALDVLNFKLNVQKLLFKWIVFENRDNELYADEYAKYLEACIKDIESLDTIKKIKESLKYWLNKQILAIKARNWDNVDYNYQKNEDFLLYHLLKKKGLDGSKLKFILDIINKKRSFNIVKKEEIVVS